MPPIFDVLKSFDLYRDGFTPEPVKAGEPTDIPSEMVEGLQAEGYIAAPENKAHTAAPELKDENGSDDDVNEGDDEDGEPATLVEIPEGWADLPWPELRSLAASVSDTPINSKDEAIAAIQAEIEARVASEDEDES